MMLGFLWPSSRSALVQIARHFGFVYEIVAPALLCPYYAALDQPRNRSGGKPKSLGGFVGGEGYGHNQCSFWYFFGVVPFVPTPSGNSAKVTNVQPPRRSFIGELNPIPSVHLEPHKGNALLQLLAANGASHRTVVDALHALYLSLRAAQPAGVAHLAVDVNGGAVSLGAEGGGLDNHRRVPSCATS